MIQDEWYFDNSGRPAGPINFAQVKRMVGTTLLGADTMVWRKGDAAPRRLEDVARETGADLGFIARPLPPPVEVRVDGGWSSADRATFRRFVARYIDLQLHGILGAFLLFYGLFSFLPITAERLLAVVNGRGGFMVGAMAGALLAVPVGALMIGWSGSSLGKWLCGIRICNGDLKPVGFRRALWREVEIYVRGLGLAIPFVFLICGAMALRRLSRRAEMTWDEDGIVVLARPHGALQIVLLTVAVGLVLGVYVVWAVAFWSHR